MKFLVGLIAIFSMSAFASEPVIFDVKARVSQIYLEDSGDILPWGEFKLFLHREGYSRDSSWTTTDLNIGQRFQDHGGRRLKANHNYTFPNLVNAPAARVSTLDTEKDLKEARFEIELAEVECIGPGLCFSYNENNDSYPLILENINFNLEQLLDNDVNVLTKSFSGTLKSGKRYSFEISFIKSEPIYSREYIAIELDDNLVEVLNSGRYIQKDTDGRIFIRKKVLRSVTRE